MDEYLVDVTHEPEIFFFVPIIGANQILWGKSKDFLDFRVKGDIIGVVSRKSVEHALGWLKKHPPTSHEIWEDFLRE